MSSASQGGEPFGVVGMGGFAHGVIRSIMSRGGTRKFRLTAVCDPAADNFPTLQQTLKENGIAVYKNYAEFLATNIKALWLPVPINLHRPFTEQALAAGKAVLCEKPAAGAIQDVDAMIAARDAAKLPVAIGYQHLYMQGNHDIKRRLLDGQLGKISDATICTAWTRLSGYYSKSWAAKIQHNGAWVLDSPANNAIAHFIHLALFLLGDKPMTSARPVAVEAELYRVNPIENYDTCCIRLTLESGVRLLICMTHATRDSRPTSMVIHGDKQTFTYASDSHSLLWEPVAPNSPTTRIAASHASHLEVLSGFEKFLDDPKCPHASLEMSRMHALAISGASAAAPVVTVQPPFHQTEKRGNSLLNYIPGIASVFDYAISKKLMVHETQLAPWSVPARKLDLKNFKEFTGPPKS